LLTSIWEDNLRWKENIIDATRKLKLSLKYAKNEIDFTLDEIENIDFLKKCNFKKCLDSFDSETELLEYLNSLVDPQNKTKCVFLPIEIIKEILENNFSGEKLKFLLSQFWEKNPAL